MDQESQDRAAQRRVKVKSSETGRTGVKRAAIKPHKRVEDNSIPKQVIEAFMGALQPGITSQTTWGTALASKAATLRTNFGLPSSDTPYLLLDLDGKARSGMVLSTTGVYLADGRGGKMAITWDQLKQLKVTYQNNMLIIGQSGITSKDNKPLAVLLQQIQNKLA